MRHYLTVPKLDYSGAPWQGGTPAEQGYKILPLPHLRRPDIADNKYHVYQNETEYKSIEADSVASAVIASKIESPHKVIRANSTLGNVLNAETLEYTGKNSSYIKLDLENIPYTKEY
jgi:hypothetical protein